MGKYFLGLLVLSWSVGCRPADFVSNKPPADGPHPDGGSETDGGGPLVPVIDGGFGTPEADAGVKASASWCDPATWGGQVPNATTDVQLNFGQSVLVDCVAQAKNIQLSAGSVLQASRSQNSSLTVNGNLVVRGRLDYGSPSDRVEDGVIAEIIFKGMNDNNFKGTPNPFPEGGTVAAAPKPFPVTVVASDYGLWVMGDGLFNAAGQTKKAWSRLTEGTGPGDGTFSVDDATGWKMGDRVALTPSAKVASSNHAQQFEERIVADVSGNTVTLAVAPSYVHAGCVGCVRRSEAANLNRNVVVRSFDDNNHAHIMVTESGVTQLDSVELRWLGPLQECTGGGPQRRTSLYFHQQRAASASSFVRHVSIWGGNNSFIISEQSDGIEMVDIAGYDNAVSGFELMFDPYTCGTRCLFSGEAPKDIIFTDMLSAKTAVPTRVEGCLPIGVAIGFTLGGDENTGAQNCVATGSSFNSISGTFGGFHWPEAGGGRPTKFTFNNNVAHNNGIHGFSLWHNNTNGDTQYQNNQSWSNTQQGVRFGAYLNQQHFKGLTAVDNGDTDFGIIAIETDPDMTHARLENATLDQAKALAYFAVPTTPVILRNVTFTGARNPAIGQIHDACSGGNGNNPADGTCIRNELRIENPQFPAGIKALDFGDHANKFTRWQVRGFSQPGSSVPANFDLYRRDNQVAGGSYNAEFDAWLVPQP